jgi:hypothetical protein
MSNLMDRLEFARDFELKVPVETISPLLLGQFAARGAAIHCSTCANMIPANVLGS